LERQAEADKKLAQAKANMEAATRALNLATANVEAAAGKPISTLKSGRSDHKDALATAKITPGT
jgi:hypothetical protein